MALDQEGMGELIDQIRGLFQSNEAAIEYGENPNEWCDEHLPEGTEPADVAHALPEVCEGLPQGYQDNCARYNASHGAESYPATASVVNEISYTYNTVYQQNAFIYAEEGAQVSNIQGDGNTVTQVDIDDSFNTNHPDSYDEYEEPENGTTEEPPEEEEAPEDGYEEPEDGDDTPEEEPPEEEAPEEAPPEEAPPEEAPEEAPPDDGGEDAPPDDGGADPLGI